jgi:flagellar hook-associated protein FlgK
MAGYEIGLSGMHAAQKALDIIGNNIANAATDGYHLQEVNLRPADEAFTGGQMVGQGVEYAGVRRLIDEVLEGEMLRHESSLSEIERKLDTLRSMESAFGELSTDGLSTSMDEFFSAFQDLSIRPQDVNLQSSVLSSAESLTSQFRNLAKELGNLIGINVVERDTGMMDITASDISLVVGAISTGVEVGLKTTDEGLSILGLRPADTEEYQTNVTGGTIGGIFSLRNETLRDIDDKLDLLAETFITQTNQLHVQGVGISGSFTSLTGWTMNETNIADMDNVTDGTIQIRVTDSFGAAQRYAVTVTAASTVASIATDIAAIPGMSNSAVFGGRLQLVADSGYSFDFLPGVLEDPSATVPDPLAGAGGAATEAPPTIIASGVYGGSEDETYTCTVNTVPPGQTYSIGTGTMEIEIRTSGGSVIKTENIGEGYSPGTTIMLENGIKISLDINGISPGYLNDGEEIVFEAIANSDSSGFLAAAGINCFFSGNEANSIAVSEFVADNGHNLAVSRSVEMTDNANAVAMGKLGDVGMAALTGLSSKEYYRQLTVGLGNQISITQMQYDNSDGIIQSLSKQREEVRPGI